MTVIVSGGIEPSPREEIDRPIGPALDRRERRPVGKSGVMADRIDNR